MATLHRKLGYMLAMGTEVGVLVGGGSYLGAWLDQDNGTSPWIFLGCLLFGIVAASWRVLDYTRRLSRMEDQE